MRAATVTWRREQSAYAADVVVECRDRLLDVRAVPAQVGLGHLAAQPQHEPPAAQHLQFLRGQCRGQRAAGEGLQHVRAHRDPLGGRRDHGGTHHAGLEVVAGPQGVHADPFETLRSRRQGAR
jgi:hypothetical protein